MTSLIVSQSLVDHLLAGDFAVDGCVCANDLDDHTHCSHHLAKCCHCDCPTGAPSRHLLPVAQLPTCTTCGGSGWVVEGQTMGWPYGEQVQCNDCKDGVPRVLTLTVRCEECDGSGNVLEWFEDRNGHKQQTLEPCHEHGPTTKQRPVARVQVEKALEIGTSASISDPPHLMVSGNVMAMGSAATTQLLSLNHLLLPGIDWSGWALLVTNVEAL